MPDANGYATRQEISNWIAQDPENRSGWQNYASDPAQLQAMGFPGKVNPVDPNNDYQHGGDWYQNWLNNSGKEDLMFHAGELGDPNNLGNYLRTIEQNNGAYDLYDNGAKQLFSKTPNQSNGLLDNIMETAIPALAASSVALPLGAAALGAGGAATGGAAGLGASGIPLAGAGSAPLYSMPELSGLISGTGTLGGAAGSGVLAGTGTAAGGGGWWPSISGGSLPSVSWGGAPSMGTIGNIGLGGLLGKLPGFGGGSNPTTGMPNGWQGPPNPAWGNGQPQARSPWQDLSGAAGLGLLGYGLAQNNPNVDLEGVFNGATGQTDAAIQAEIAKEQQQRADYMKNLQASRAEGLKSLEDILGQGSQGAMERAINDRAGQLNKMGLLEGPSGAMDFATAQEAAKLRERQLPRLADYATGTQSLMDQANASGLQGTLDLQQGGMGRNFGLGDLQRSASLKSRLLAAQREDAQKRALLGAGSTLLGYGMGGTSGAEVGSRVGRNLEDVFSPSRTGNTGQYRDIYSLMG